MISTRDHPGQGSVLAVLPDRLKTTVKAFLEAVPVSLKATIQTVCTDMAEGYVNTVEEVLPRVTVVVDRFQVAQADRDRVEQRRKPELKRLKQELPAAADEPLKGLVGRVCQDWTALSEAEQDRLLPWFRDSPTLQQAYGWR